jgi:hypothetical protein
VVILLHIHQRLLLAHFQEALPDGGDGKIGSAVAKQGSTAVKVNENFLSYTKLDDWRVFGRSNRSLSGKMNMAEVVARGAGQRPARNENV